MLEMKVLLDTKFCCSGYYSECISLIGIDWIDRDKKDADTLTEHLLLPKICIWVYICGQKVYL